MKNEKTGKQEITLPKYSVLMSVYAGEKPEFFRLSVDSMLGQTWPADDFVLVCDGKLTPELDGLIRDYERYNSCFHVIRSEEHIGTAACANLGLSKCRNEYIVKMDSDDIAVPERCEISLRVMARHPWIDMLGSYIREFDSDTGKTVAVRKTPLSHKEIMRFARRRNPFNNQTLVYRKSAVERAGGYSDVERCEDYDFVIRMLSSGALGRNIGRELVNYRVTSGNYDRRRNWANTKSFIRVRWRILRQGFSSPIDFIIPVAAQLFIFIMPKRLTAAVYKRFLRS